MIAERGRRERKRLKTRDRIATAARELFAARGFDAVTVAEVAEVADVSEQTVYNHFATKEDLVFWRRGAFEAGLVEAVRDRPQHQSPLDALHDHLTRTVRSATAGDTDPSQPVDALATAPPIATAVTESPSLRARELALVADATAALADVLAAETDPGNPGIEPAVAAAAMFGAAQAIIAHARKRVTAGDAPQQLAAELDRCTAEAIALLDRGLGGFAVRRQG